MKTINPSPAAAIQMSVDPAYAGADAVVLLVPGGKGYEVVVDNRVEMPDEVLGALVRQAADEIEGKDDRSRGCWGR